jgi:hypothetical protein
VLLIVFGLLLIAADLLPDVGINPEALSFGIELVMGVTFLVFALSDRLDGQRRVAWRHHAAAIAVSIVIATAAAEGATRWMFRHVTTSADGGAYFSRQWRDVTLNSHGFRERDFGPKPPETYRIAVIGDSFTFGNGLAHEERFSELLGKWLGTRFEVLNFGMPGNNTPDHLRTLRNSVLPASPNFVVMQWFVNDIEGSDLSRRPKPALLMPHADLHHWLNPHSALYAIANMRWAEIQIMLGWSPSYADYLKARAGDPHSADAVREAQLLHEIVETAHRSKVNIAFLLFPDTGPALDVNYPFAFLHERVLERCRIEGISCLDLREAFARQADRRALWVSPFDHHPSARANQIAARQLFDLLQRETTR